MPTPNPADACPSLHVLTATLGTNTEGQPLYPAHVLSEQPRDGRCKHCHTIIDPCPYIQPSGHQHGWSRPTRVR